MSKVSKELTEEVNIKEQKSTKKKKDITFFVVIQREDEEEYNQEYKNKRPSVDALEIKGGKS